MLDLINRYAHGFVAIPVILACREQGLFELLREPMSSLELASCLEANEGHLQVALRLLHSLNWLSRNDDGQYTLTAKAASHRDLPADLLSLYQLDMSAYLMGEGSGLLREWLSCSQQRWDVSDPLLADFLDGVVVIPLLLALHQKDDGLEGEKIQLRSLPPSVREELSDLLVSKGWARRDGMALLLADGGLFWNEADRLLIALAGLGYFPTSTWFRHFLSGSPFDEPALWFDTRPYIIRHPRLSDLPALLRLEDECWPESLRASASEIQERIERPSVHCVLEMALAPHAEGKVVGVIYSQRIESSELLDEMTFREVSSLHTEQGSIIQLLAANVLPEVQHYGLGDQLLEFMLQYCTLKDGIERVVAVTLCKNYVHHSHPSASSGHRLSMEDYIQKRNERGKILDPILYFHESHGATIKRVIDGYRPEDDDNQGKGVLIEYDLKLRLNPSHPARRRAAEPRREGSRPLNEQIQEEGAVSDIVAEAVRQLLPATHQSAFSPTRPLMEMGLDSLDLLELRTLLSQRLGKVLEPTFFFRYGTPEAITRYFEGQVATPTRSKDPSTGSGHRFSRSGPTETTEVVTTGARETTSVVTTNQKDYEPIAIIGMACRFPGGVSNPSQYWTLLRDGVDAISEVPKTRWDVEGLREQIKSAYGGFLEQVDQFDASFFRMAPVEAISTDPQQRILLEVTWEALEHAGINPHALAGTETGVFIGIFSHDYEYLQLKQSEKPSPYFGTGTSSSVAAGRLSYFFGFQGPAISVDTACSSSLVALHLACQSLRTGECDLALASGVNLLLSPELSITFSQAGMLAPDGHCKTFDASANGYVRSEGCGVVVLKRLSEAVADQDRILAVVRGSAINQDGTSNGLTAPNGLAQEAVIRQALENGGVEAAQVSYVEAHGTGTGLGDPVEVKALEAVYGVGRENPLIIGSVKTNIGHTEAAAGLAGLLKVVLSMQAKMLPPHLHFKKANPHLDLARIPALIPTNPMAWQNEPRLAGVSSFGFSGTNAHVILEEAPSATEQTEPPIKPSPASTQILTLSAKSDPALRQLAQRYTQIDHLSLADLCFTANTGRAHFAHRLALVAHSPAELKQQLSAFAAGEETNGLVSGLRDNQSDHQNQPPKIAFLFTGQGSQYVGMGRELYETQPTFRQAIDRCDEILRPLLDRSLLSVLYPSNHDSPINQTAYTQPALFALEYALAKLWQSWGIFPSVVMGHSVGEYVAACVAGVFSLEDGLKLIAERGRLMQSLPQDGDMVAILASEATVALFLAPYANKASFAAINGPNSVVISGERDAIERVIAALPEGIRFIKLNVSHAFHSPLMEPILERFREVANEVTFSLPQACPDAGRITLIGNITGERVTHEVTTPDYWVRHIRQAVRFADGMQTLHQMGVENFVEIGPKPTLLGMGRRCLPNGGGMWLPSLRPANEWPTMLASVAQLYVQGAKIDWAGFYREKLHSYRKVVLPTYPFQRERYWIEGEVSDHRLAAPQAPLVALFTGGNSKQLAQQLEKSSYFTEEQRKLLPELLEVLKHQLQVESASAKDCLHLEDMIYEVKWQAKGLFGQLPPEHLLTPSEIGHHVPPHEPLLVAQTSSEVVNTAQGSWLILADAQGIGQVLAAHLRAKGADCTLVYLGQTFKQTGEQTYQIQTDQPAHFQKVLDAPKQPLRGIIHLWSLDAPSNENLTIQTLQAASLAGCGSTLHLVQSLLKSDLPTSSTLLSTGMIWLVTQGAQPVALTPPALAQSPLWGMGKVIALEHPELWGGMIDLPAQIGAEEAATRLLAEVLSPDGEDHIAFRGRERYVARLLPHANTQSAKLGKELPLQPDATYLITGGLGFLGRRVARWLVEKGARHVILTSRSGKGADWWHERPSHETLRQQTEVQALEEMGATVEVLSADVADPTQMSRLFESLNPERPLRGIIHAAGVGSFETMQELSIETLDLVFRAKTIGTWLLHQLSKEMKVDFFICFSSAGSVWGAAKQALYDAANHFLDGFAHYRRAMGLPALSINWGSIAEGGMVTEEYHHWLMRIGIDPLTVPLTLDALGYLLKTNAVQATVAKVNWGQFKDVYEVRGPRPLLEQLKACPERGGIEKEEMPQTASAFEMQRLKEMPASNRQPLLTAHLQAELAKVLGARDLPDPKMGFFDMGMDSLMAVEFKNRLERTLEHTFSSTLLFNYPNLKGLSQHLLSRMGLDTPEAPAETLIYSKKAEEPIAIIGMSCRLPGANDPETFWQLLLNGVDAISEVPPERWDINAYYAPSPTAGKTISRCGGFIEDVDQFDPLFFGISPREAVGMDPQQRLLLEVSWEALERAGQVRSRLASRQTGVFIGITSNDYAHLLAASGALPDAYTATSNVLNAAAGRLSYVLGLTGPAMAIDTACSSSLVAIHQAVMSLQQGECEQALAGGVNLILSPKGHIGLSQANMLSPDGRCKTFDAAADGYVRSEGCGIVVLKRVSDARRDADNILALIRGSAVNQDGPSSGLTVPNGLSQQALIRQTVQKANVTPEEVTYIEAHGTGTSLGDPIEIEALGTVFRERSPNNPLVVGSVKSNIGHLESAAGVAGLIKVVLCLQHQQIPPHLHFKDPNPHINWHDLPVLVPTILRDWQPVVGRRIAGISSFGASGTNAHLIVEQAPQATTANKRTTEPEETWHLLTLSAKTEEVLLALAEHYQKYLTSNAQASLADICFTANTGRAHFENRLSLVASSKSEMAEKLANLLAGHKTNGVWHGYINRAASNSPTFRDFSEILRMFGNLGGNEHSQFLSNLAQWYVDGGEIDWATFYQNETRIKVVLPTYPWKRQRYWVAKARQKNDSSLLGTRLRLPFSNEIRFDTQLSPVSPPYLDDHRLYGTVVVPASSHISMVLLAVREAYGRDACQLERLLFPEALVLSDESTASVQLILTDQQAAHQGSTLDESASSKRTLQIVSQKDESWAVHVTGQLSLSATTSAESIKLVEIQSRCQHFLSGAQFNQELWEMGYTLGASFRWIDEIWLGEGESLCKMQRPHLPDEGGAYQLHAGLIDSCFQTIVLNMLGRKATLTKEESIYIPFQIATFRLLHGPNNHLLSSIWCHTRLRKSDDVYGRVEGDIGLFDDTGRVMAKVIGLELRKAPRQALLRSLQKDYSNWLYEMVWEAKEVMALDTKESSEGGSWLIFADESGIGTQLARQLSQQGERCVLVFAKPGATYQKVSTNHRAGRLTHYHLNPAVPEDVQRLIKTISDSEPIGRIVHLWSLEVQEADHDTSCGSVLHLVQALIRLRQKPRLWLVTRGAQNVAGSDIGKGIWQAPLWGLGRVIAQEHPELKCVCLDLAPDAGNSVDDEIQQLFNELCSLNREDQREDQVAFRHGERYVARLRSAQLAVNQPLLIDGEGCYLITGGLGALGRQMAHFLVAQGARHLLLTGRRGAASDAAEEMVRQLEEKGTQVKVIKADISKPDDVARVLEAASAPLRGVIHAAGVLDDGILIEQSLNRFSKVMAPKVQGAWNLHQLTLQMPLDFFVLFSSAASLLGSAGQANYAAANAFMDGLAHYRRARGLPALAINWGPWGNLGMASTLKVKRRLANSGWKEITPLEGWQIFVGLLKTDATQVGVLPIKGNLNGAFSRAAPAPRFREQLEAAPVSQHRELLMGHLREQIAKVIGLSESVRLKPSQRLFDLGLDSLMALELKKNLELSTGYALDSTLLFDYPTLGALENYLSQEVLSASSLDTPRSIDERTALSDTSMLLSDEKALSDFDQLSKNDLLALLDKKLSHIESEI